MKSFETKLMKPLENKIYSYLDDCPVVPKHLSHRISQENWNWINETSKQLCGRQPQVDGALAMWQVRGYWLISYFMNPSEENLRSMLLILNEYHMLGDNNLMYIEFVADLKSRVKGC